MPKVKTPASKNKLRVVTRTKKAVYVNLNMLLDEDVTDVRVTRTKLKSYGDVLIIQPL